ncbi:MAG: T9SS type A sorting domain-containing protein, partial [Flavobacteriaceae bacterium]|nr:T9SS type A sorting domain-containing protein [Flavobacteriaceae bacterium]
FITISDDAGTTTLASGTGTVVWTATASANVRFYTHLDSNCTPDDQSLRARTVKCGTLTYCGPIVFDFNVEPITLVDFAGIHNETSPAINGTPDHEDFTTTVAPGNVKQGFPYQISVNGNADPIGFSYENYYVVFIDWNQNGVLNDAGEVYFGDGSLFLIDSDGVSNPPATGVITVPSGATLGNTLMRVKKVYSFGAPLVFPFTDPCEGDTYGQVEDYTITVDIPPTTAPDCTGFEITYPENQDVIAGGNVTLTWTAAANSIGYHVKVGTTFGGIEVFGGDVIGATSLTVSLDPDTIYYLSVTPYNNISDAACTEEILFQTDDSPIGCTNAPNGQWPGGTFTPACYGAPQVVAGCGYAGEYSLVAVTAGTEYIFSSSIGTDFITISDANGIVTLAAGTGPVTWTATASQVVRFYTHVDANCGAQSVCRDRMVQCGSPITFPPPPYSCYQGDGGMSGLENGYGVDPTDIFRVADDFIVPTGTLFTLKQVTINVLSAAPITNATINIHDDNGGLPGDVSDTFTMAPSSSQIFGSAFGLDAYRLTFDLVTPIDFSAGTYWLEPTISNGGGTVYWEVTTLSSTGLPVRLSNTSGVAWVPDDSGLDYNTVFYVAGDCTTLSVGEAGNTGLAYYPNPVKDVLNITSKQKVESVEIYSVAGQKVMTVSKVTDGKVNVSRLSQGVYVFRVKLENGQVETFKIVKD